MALLDSIRDGNSDVSVHESPAIDNQQLLLPQDEDLDIATIFKRVIAVSTAQNVQAFVRKASVITLELPDLEMYLTTFERAHIVTSEEKYKILFLHAANLENIEQAEIYKKQGALNSKQLVLELFRKEKATRPVMQLLTHQGLALFRDEVTLPLLHCLLVCQVDANKISIDNKSLLSWALQTENDHLIDLAIRSKSRFCENIFQDHAALLFFARRLEVPAETISSLQVLQELKKMGIDLKAALAAIISYAASVDDDEILSFLHAEGFDTNAPFEDQNTPLHIALEKSRAKFARALLANGAKLDVQNAKGITPLQLLLSNNAPEMQAFLLEPAICNESISLAALNASLKASSMKEQGTIAQFLEIFVKKQPLEVFYTPEGMELFGLFCRFGAKEAMSFVLEQGYDINALQMHGHSLFSKLIEQKNVLTIAHLYVSGHVEQSMKTADGTPILFWLVAQRHNSQPLKLVLKKGLSFDQLGNDKETLLHQAAKNQHPFNVQCLLDMRAIDVNALDKYGRPALFYALAKGSNPEVVAQLLAAGARPFHLGEQLLQYTNYILNNRLQLIAGSTHLWNRFSESREESFATYINQLSADALPLYIRQEVLEIAFLLPKLLHKPLAIFISKEEYLESLLLLQKKYPDAPNEFFYPFLAHLRNDHLEQPVTLQKHVGETLEEKFANELAQFREFINKRVSGAPRKEARVPSSPEIVAYSPNPQEQGESPSPQMLFDFAHEYDVRSIIPFASRFLKREIEINKEAVISWFKNNIPEGFASASATELEWASHAVALFYHTPEEQKAILPLLLKTEQVTQHEDSPETTLKKIREQEFITSFVFEKESTTVSPAALFIFLEKQLVLQEIALELFAEFFKKKALT